MEVKDLKDVMDKIKDVMPQLQKKFKVKKIGVFGSFSSGKATSFSDVDIFVEFYEPVGFEFIKLKLFLEDVLGRRVDLVTYKALKPEIRDEILKEVKYA